VYFSVAIPFINVTAPNTQIVGQSLTLECSVTTVRGITSRVDIVWTRNGIIVSITEGVNINSTTKESQLYRDLYTITLIKTADSSAMYQCEVLVNTSPWITANRSIILDIDGMGCI